MYRKLLPATVVKKHLNWRLFLTVTSAAIAAVLFTQSLSVNRAEGMPMYGGIAAVSNAM
jgi:hypothetical protein